MAVVGAIEDGTTGNCTTLVSKSVLDFIISLVFPPTVSERFFGGGILVYEGLITARRPFRLLCAQSVISDISFVGSALIFCVA